VSFKKKTLLEKFKVSKIREKIYEDNDFKPIKIPLASIVQLPFWICFSTSFRDFSFGANCKHIFKSYLSLFKIDNFLYISTCSPLFAA
jgi:hypothetical protein